MINEIFGDASVAVWMVSVVGSAVGLLKLIEMTKRITNGQKKNGSKSYLMSQEEIKWHAEMLGLMKQLAQLQHNQHEELTNLRILVSKIEDRQGIILDKVS